eukprot:1143778-Pelagomonas_calceolata.AAC.4
MSKRMLTCQNAQISSLYSGGVDLFFVDLACATLESKAMLCALEQFVSRIEAPLPLVLCGIVTDSCSQMVGIEALLPFCLWSFAALSRHMQANGPTSAQGVLELRTPFHCTLTTAALCLLAGPASA